MYRPMLAEHICHFFGQIKDVHSRLSVSASFGDVVVTVIVIVTRGKQRLGGSLTK